MKANLKPVPTLEILLRDPQVVADVPINAVPDMLAQLEGLKARLWVRLMQIDSGPNENRDRLLGIKEAAAKLHVSTDYLYRHASNLPFTVGVGHKILFSENAIERYIAQRMGR